MLHSPALCCTAQTLKKGLACAIGGAAQEGEHACQSLNSVSEGRFGQGCCDALIQSGDWPVRYLQCPHATILQKKAKIELRLTGSVVLFRYRGLFVCCQECWKNAGQNLNWTSRLEIAWKSFGNVKQNPSGDLKHHLQRITPVFHPTHMLLDPRIAPASHDRSPFYQPQFVKDRCGYRTFKPVTD